MFRILNAAEVEYIVVGGMAAIAHGVARVTYDLDIVYRRTSTNYQRICSALGPYNPYPRDAPPGLPFKFDPQIFEFGVNFTLTTTIGAVDLLGEITGGGDYDALYPFTLLADFENCTIRCLTLDKLIEVKRATGRPKDFEAISEFEALRDEQEVKDQ